MNKIKKMMFINIIITIFIVITGFTSIVYAADITLTKENDDIWAPFFKLREMYGLIVEIMQNIQLNMHQLHMNYQVQRT